MSDWISVEDRPSPTDKEEIRDKVRKILEDSLGCPVMFSLNVFYGDKKDTIIGNGQ
jgi:hypothetical protein